MSVVRVGCPMWAHKPWVGRWYPANTRAGTELALYTRLCNAVEGNTTFYAEPSADTVARWLEQSPSDFRFAFKLPRTVTHDQRLQDVREPVRSFLNRIEPLGERIGPVQAQLPPAFGPEGFDVLAAFVRRLPLDWPWAVELRHPGWFDGGLAHQRLDELLNERGIGRVVLDTRPLYSVPAGSTASVEERSNKPRLPITLDAVGPRPIIRVIGEDQAEGTLGGLLTWVPFIVDWVRAGREPYLFVHQPENLDSPGIARQIYDAIRIALPELGPLPEPDGVEANDQPALFDL
ncbi:MAG: DUF72 domain-containing protein [Actinomycetota bacterium]